MWNLGECFLPVVILGVLVQTWRLWRRSCCPPGCFSSPSDSGRPGVRLPQLSSIQTQVLDQQSHRNLWQLIMVSNTPQKLEVNWVITGKYQELCDFWGQLNKYFLNTSKSHRNVCVPHHWTQLWSRPYFLIKLWHKTPKIGIYFPFNNKKCLSLYRGLKILC